MRRGIGYIRVSRVAGRAGDSFLSPDLQRERIAAAAAAHDVEIVEWIEDLDESGGKWARPGFQRSLELVEDGTADVIVVARLTRFARSVLDTHRALERLDNAGGALIAADLNVDATTSTGKLIRDVLAALAEFELEVARENWRAAKSSAIARGIRIGRPPIGYRLGPDRRLEPDPAQAPVVRDVFRARAAGASSRDLVHLLHDRLGVWVAPQTVGDMLRNRAYLGEARLGDLVNEEAHDPIVTIGEFAAVQTVVAPRAPRGEGTLLAGVLVCAGCGRRMAASTGKRLKDGSKALDYRCTRYSRHGPCPAPASIIRGPVEDLVERLVLERADVVAEGTARTDREVDAAVRELDAARAELDGFLAAGVVDVVGAAAFRRAVEERQRRVQAASDRVEALRGAGHVEALRVSMREVWDDLGVQERRRLIASVVESVTVSRSGGGRLVAVEDRVVVRWR